MNKKPKQTNTDKIVLEESDSVAKSLRSLKNKSKKLKKREEEIKQELQFSANNKEFTKHLSDIKSSLETIEQCISTLETIQNDKEDTQTNVLEENKTLKEENIQIKKEKTDIEKSLKESIRELNSEIKKLKSDNKTLESKNEHLKKLNQSILDKESKSSKRFQDNEIANSKFRKENQSLIEEVSLKRVELESIESIHQKKIYEINQSNEGYKQQISRQIHMMQQQIDQHNNTAFKNAQLLENTKLLLNSKEESLINLKNEMDQLKDQNDKNSKEFFKKVKENEFLLKEISSLKEKIHVLNLEKEQIKFEEEFIDTTKSKNEIEEIVKVIQIVNFFDLSKPDGLDIRKMFLSDQFNKMNQGIHCLITKFEDFYVFDHFCQSLVGLFDSKYEEKLTIGKIMIQKLLSKSNDECIFGITFKKLSEIIFELSTSSIFLYQKTLVPYQIEEDFNLPKVIPNEEAILNSLSLRDASPKTPSSDNDFGVWNYNILYEQSNQFKQQQQEKHQQEIQNQKSVEESIQNQNQIIPEETSTDNSQTQKEKSNDEKQEKTRWRKPYNRIIKSWK
eukprot:gene3774-6662_t